MFDYQAGEKYKLTLIMVAVAGIMAGMFFAVLLMPAPEAPHKRIPPKYMNDPDITGVREIPNAGEEDSQQQLSQTSAKMLVVDPYEAKTLIDRWLPVAWDLSAGTAQASQEQAMAYMTPECATAYKQNVWTEELAKQIEEAGLKSSFNPAKVTVGNVRKDGTLVITVIGTQTLTASSGNRSRDVHLEYLMHQTQDGLKIAGISEAGKGGR